jgi:hypothetical protein
VSRLCALKIIKSGCILVRALLGVGTSVARVGLVRTGPPSALGVGVCKTQTAVTIR